MISSPFRCAALTALALSLAAPAAFGQTRVLESDFGAVELPESPQRIVTTFYGATQPLLDLGLLPVGQGQVPPQSNVPPDYWPLLQGIDVVSLQGAELNYEKILELQPDLILEVNAYGEERLERLNAIAPTLMVGTHGEFRGQWEHRVFRVAQATGTEAVYEQRKTELAARQAEIADKYGDFLAENPIAIWSAWEAGSPFINPSNTMIGNILTPAGAVFAAGGEAYKLPTGAETQLSNEDIGTALADASIIFYVTDMAGNINEATEGTRTLANYSQLPAVQAGAEFPAGKIVIAGFGDAMAALDYFEAAIAALQQK